MFWAPELVFSGTEGVGSRFHVLRDQTRFRRLRGRRITFSCFGRPDSFSAVQRASDPVFMSCATGLVLSGNEGVESHFHVLRSRTRFRRYRGRRVPFSCFALPDTFSGVTRSSGPVFMFCTPELVFGGTEGVGSLFHILRARTRFRRYRGRRVPFLRFVCSDSFSTVPRVTGPIFMFCAAGLIFSGTEGGKSRFNVLRVRTRFHVTRARTLFQPYRGCRVQFSCYVRMDSFSWVTRPSGPIFIFCAPKLIFSGNEGVGFRFDVLRSRTHFRR
jgi:hypothetical protein